LNNVGKGSGATRGKTFLTLLGLALGIGACLLMFLAVAARYIETESAQDFARAGILSAFLMTTAPLVLGLLPLFLRGFGLWRVPLYSLCGVAVTYAVMRILGVNLLAWSYFVETLR
jgi:hypothetical protein